MATRAAPLSGISCGRKCAGSEAPASACLKAGRLLNVSPVERKPALKILPGAAGRARSCRLRAGELRAAAITVADHDARAGLIPAAETYERWAARLEKMAGGGGR
jgi:hypothetical protein